MSNLPVAKWDAYKEQQRRWELLHPPIPTTITVRYVDASRQVTREYVVPNTVKFPDRAW